MPGSGHDWNMSLPADNFPGIPNQPGVMNYSLLSLSPLQYSLGKQPHKVISFNKSSLFIKQEAAVKVAVPGNTNIRFLLYNCPCCIFPVAWQQRIGNTVRETAIRLML